MQILPTTFDVCILAPRGVVSTCCQNIKSTRWWALHSCPVSKLHALIFLLEVPQRRLVLLLVPQPELGRLGADIEVITTPPCTFCMENR